ncbi:DUF6502 family protein [Roseomonas sp. F4]
MPDLPEPPPAPELLRAVARLLRPLLRLLIRAGITYPVFAELVRGLYVQVAQQQLGPAGTDSRLSLLTGVHRKELRRLRELPPDAPEVPEVVSLGGQIVARWLGMAEFSDAAGQPLPLPRAAPPGQPSFEALVAGVTRDVRPRAVLDDWQAQGLVRLDAAERVVLQQAAFLPRAGSAAQLHYFARNLHDHIAAATHNLAGGTPRQLERSVHYDRLPADAAQRMQALGREGAERLLVALNREMLALLEGQDPPAPGTPTQRVNLGVYLHAEAETEEPGATGA